MKKTVALILTMLLMLALCSTAFAENVIEVPELTKRYTATLGSASIGSNLEMVSAAFCAVINLHESNLNMVEQVTGGGSENSRLLRNGEIDFGTSSDGIELWLGEGVYEGEGETQNIRSVMTVYYTEFVLVTLANNNDVNSIYDLEGKSVAFGPAGSTCYTACEWLFKACGMLDKVTVQALSYADANDALIDGTVDAVFGFTNGHIPGDAIMQLDTSTKLKLVAMDKDVIDAAANEIWVPTILQVGDMSCITEDSPRDSFRSKGQVTYCLADTPNEVVYNYLKNIYENLEELGTYHKVLTTISMDNALSGFSTMIPVHPGAAAFYMDMGMWDDSFTYSN